MNSTTMMAVFALVLAGGGALAGPVQDFEAALRASYGDYRTALFVTNSGDAAKSSKAIAALEQSWSGLSATYESAPPPQYETDGGWAQTIGAVQAIIDAAKADVAAGDLAKAHADLEGIRAEIGELHERNGLSTFSDRMNAYHAAMENVLGLDLAATDAVTLAEQAGVLTYLAAELVRLPAPEAAGNAEYRKLQEAFVASVKAYQDAVHSQDAAAIKAAVGGLKVPYSKFFLKFG
jgi:hypothetical protein